MFRRETKAEKELRLEVANWRAQAFMYRQELQAAKKYARHQERRIDRLERPNEP